MVKGPAIMRRLDLRSTFRGWANSHEVPGINRDVFCGKFRSLPRSGCTRSPGSAAFRGVTLGARRAPDASGKSKATTHAGVRRARNNPRFASVHTGRRVFRSRNTRVWLMIYGSTEA